MFSYRNSKHTQSHKCKTYIKYLVFLSFVDLASQAAVSQCVLDDVLVGLGAGLLIKFRSCRKEKKHRKEFYIQ